MPNAALNQRLGHERHKILRGQQKARYVTVIETQLQPPKKARALPRPQQQTPRQGIVQAKDPAKGTTTTTHASP